MTPATTVYLLRHGESEINRLRRITSEVGGPLDLPLTPLGQRQAAHAAAWLRAQEAPPGHVFSAPARRARETAGIVATGLSRRSPPPVGGPPAGVTVLDGLDEVRAGGLEGRGDAAAWALHGETLRRWHAGELDFRFPGPGGESFTEALARFEGALREMARRHPGGAVAAVTHGAIQLTTVPRLCPTVERGPGLPNVAISILEVTPDGFACRLWGSVAHLPG